MATLQQLATTTDLYKHGLPAASFGSISVPDQQAALDSASAKALGMLGGRYKAPLVSWDDDLTEAVCKIATYNLMSVRGFNPAAGADVNLLARHDQAVAWLMSVARQEISPNIVGQPDQSPTYDAPRIISLPLQGWDRGVVR